MAGSRALLVAPFRSTAMLQFGARATTRNAVNSTSIRLPISFINNGSRFLHSSPSLCNGSRPVRTAVSVEERAALRAARKERATRLLQQQQAGESGGEAAGATAGSVSSTGAASTSRSLAWSRWVWYLGLGVPTVLLVWGFQDENSPPAKFSRMIGLTDFIAGYTDQLAKPSFDKLLPDWSQVSVQHVNMNLFCTFLLLIYPFRIVSSTPTDAKCSA